MYYFILYDNGPHNYISFLFKTWQLQRGVMTSLSLSLKLHNHEEKRKEKRNCTDLSESTKNTGVILKRPIKSTRPKKNQDEEAL